MIGKTLKDGDSDGECFVFLEFNAWLYQGYDDARMALLQSVSDCLLAEAEKRKSGIEKAKDFAKRINWLKIGKLLAPAAAGAVAKKGAGDKSYNFLTSALASSDFLESRLSFEHFPLRFVSVLPSASCRKRRIWIRPFLKSPPPCPAVAAPNHFLGQVLPEPPIAE